jgi:hypothetical protein
MSNDLFQQFMEEKGEDFLKYEAGCNGEEPRRYNPLRDTEIAPGVVAMVHSLQSTRGEDLNNKRCIVLQQLDEGEENGRWLVQVQEEDVTTALKAENLKLPQLPSGETHPSYAEMSQWQMQFFGKAMKTVPRKYETARGVTFPDDEPFYRARKLVELLDRSMADGYEPNRTILHGVALQFNYVISETSMSSDFTMTDLEHIAALIGLAGMCQGESFYKNNGDCRPDAVVFALLEAAPVSLDVWMGFMVITPYIGPREGYSRVENQFRVCRQTADFNDWSLTPDQTTDDYCKAMRGPMGILYYATNLKEHSGRLDIALLRRLEKHALFSKVLHRLCRLVAREIRGTNDGKGLGRTARIILADMAGAEKPLTKQMYDMLVADKPVWKNGPVVLKLLRKSDIKSYEELRAFFDEIKPQK